MLHRAAERLFRAQANRTNRQRLRSDTSMRPGKPPRGCIVSTGEDVPRGQSLRSRMIILDVAPGAVKVDILTACQRDAAAGIYAQATAGFVQWLAPRYERLQRRFPKILEKLRHQALKSGMHRRTPENVANLALGWGYFLHFARHIGVLTPKESLQKWHEGWQVLGEVANAQLQYIEAAEPTRRFLELLREAIASGKAHLAASDGSAPVPPGAYGWRRPADTESLRPQGVRIGWSENENIYLLPDASYSTAQALGREIGDGLVITPQTLRKRLHEKGVLSSTDPKRQTLTIRKVVEGKSQNVLHISLEGLFGEFPDKPDIDSSDSPSYPKMSGFAGPNVGSMSGEKGQHRDYNHNINNGLHENVGFVGKKPEERPIENQQLNPDVGSVQKSDSKTRHSQKKPDTDHDSTAEMWRENV